MTSTEKTSSGKATILVSVDEIVGYVEPWIVSPGDTAHVKISSTKPTLSYRMVRLLQGLTVENAPPTKKEVIENGPKGQCKGRFQKAFPGSFGEVTGWPRELRLQPLDGIHFTAYFEPWKLNHEYVQTLVSTLDTKSASGFSVSINTDNQLLILIGNGTRVESLSVPFLPRWQRWCSLGLKIYYQQVELIVKHLPDHLEPHPEPTVLNTTLSQTTQLNTTRTLLFAAEHDDTKPTHISFPEGVQLLLSENYKRMVRRNDLGLSIYDIHSDGSGNVFSTTKRPILNIRPDYVHWGFQRPREFSAELLLVGFLEEQLGDGYDVLTDHDLDLQGPSALASYDVVIAGSHPEYPSARSLDAYEGYAKLGKWFLYPGEWKYVAQMLARVHMSFPTVTAGMLWNASKEDFGDLLVAHRTNYLELEAALQVKDQVVLFTLLLSQATIKNTAGSGRASIRKRCLESMALLEVPAGMSWTVERHDDHFMLFNEELIIPMINTLGSTSELVRSGIVFYETNRNGAIFSVGSINWNNSLAWNNYSNDVAQMTEMC
ncbi:N,N-dimethylformamidase beta subunit [Talaromyces pinophilus]|nr:N,N-dimethylformamidase beta subunit [Talaromyces pinophilus]